MDKENSIATLSPCSSGRRTSASNSPEFEFWRIQDPSSQQPNLLSADELFVDGVLLPLQLLHLHPNCDLTEPTPPPDPKPPNSEPLPAEPEPEPEPELDTEAEQGTGASAAIADSTSSFSSSKRWKDIFKRSEKKSSASDNGTEDRDREKEKKKERKSGNGGSSSAELNINIWPFSRSRSAGNAGARPKMFTGTLGIRKVNSAPCSRSNSTGESKSRKWPSSPNRSGVHLGRSSPVWQVKRSGSGIKNSSDHLPKHAEKGFKKETKESRLSKLAPKSGSVTGGGRINNGKAKVLNLNVPMCIGYRHNLSCRSNENGSIGVVGGVGSAVGSSRGNSGGCDGGGGGRNVGNSGNLFNLRNLFTKKSALASH